MNKLEKFILNEMIDSLPYFKGVSVCSPSNLVLVLLKDDYYYTKSVEEIRAWINEYFITNGAAETRDFSHERSRTSPPFNRK